MRNKKVLILYKYLPQWRADFFDNLRNSLNNEGIELSLIYGKLKNVESLKQDEVDIKWGKYIENKTFKILNTEFYWQPVLKYIFKSDLVIIEQANKLLINYLLVILRKMTRLKVAFWGHGIDLMRNPNSIQNRFKLIYANHVDWWFAYTKGVERVIVNNGFNRNRTSILNNSINTKKLKYEFQNITSQKIEKLKIDLNIKSKNVAIYCGGMYKEKRLDFLLETCTKIKKEITDFEMIFLGAGTESWIVKDFALSRNWIHYIGPVFGEERIPYFKLARVLLLPDAVGLAILDSFVFETPLITTKGSYHGPEIEYLDNGINGMMTENNIDEYSQTIVRILNDRTTLKDLITGCKIVSDKYNIENMVSNFTDGVLKCLSE